MIRNRFNRSTILAVITCMALGASALSGCASGGGDLGPQAARESLPGFPSDAPIPAGTLQPMVVDEDTNHWAFTVYVNDADAQEAVVKNYTSQGYSETGRSEYNGTTNVSLEKGTVDVTLAFEQDPDGRHRVIFNVIDQSGAAVPQVTIDEDGNVSGVDGEDAPPTAGDTGTAPGALESSDETPTSY